MSTLQTLDRGLLALEVVSDHPDGISIAELAERLGVHRAICYRIVATLNAHGLVARELDGRVRIGAGATMLAARYAPALSRAAGPLLRRLANETDATSFVCVAEGEEGVVLAVAEPEHAVIRVGYRMGTRHPLTLGAAGVAILAARPPQPGEREAVTVARREGVSVTRGELERGAVGIAAPVPRLPGGPIHFDASIGVVAIDGLALTGAASAVRAAAAALGALAAS